MKKLVKTETGNENTSQENRQKRDHKFCQPFPRKVIKSKIKSEKDQKERNN